MGVVVPVHADVGDPEVLGRDGMAGAFVGGRGA